MKLQKYIVKAYFYNKGSVDVEVLPVTEISKDTIIKKIESNMSMSNEFTLYGFDWTVKEIKSYGYEIFSIPEFFGES